jgi:stalled ribosome rescue protein Dom34
MKILTQKEFQADLAKMWSEAVHAEYKAQIEAAVLEERKELLDIVYSYAANLSWNEDFQNAIRARSEK